MNTVPIPVRKLCLTIQFDLSECDDYATLPSKDHHQALTQAAKSSGLYNPDVVYGKAVTVPGDLTVAVAQDVQFDELAVSGEKPIAAQYIYSSDKPQMVLRCLVCLADCDGVTALRIALHAMELIEGQSTISDPAVFATPPPYKYGWRQRLNFARMLSSTLGSIFYATTFGGLMSNKRGAAKKIGAPEGVVVPTSAISTLEYYKPGGAAEPAAYNLYADTASTSSLKPYKRFVDVIESWRKKLGLRAVFVLINATPKAIPAEVKTARDVMDYAKRYGGAFDHPTAPPGEDIWPVNNFYHSRVVFVNNYGRHAMSIKAKPTAFKWDWVGMAAHVWGAGCIQVNGKFMGWMRGTKEGLAVIDDEATTAVGARVETLRQMRRENITEVTVSTKDQHNAPTTSTAA